MSGSERSAWPAKESRGVGLLRPGPIAHVGEQGVLAARPPAGGLFVGIEEALELVLDVQVVRLIDDEVVHGVLTCLFVGGHCLLEGVPGLGKTLLVRTLAQTLELDFSRIQFTPDLMPADILGTNMVVESAEGKRVFEFQKGPVFCNILLADEINRATPKTQSALLEAMQERQVTIGDTTFALPDPFLVLATQNPIESEGVYPLPEAQRDRFLMRIPVDYPTAQDEHEIVARAGGPAVIPEAILSLDDVRTLQRAAANVYVDPAVQDYAVRLVLATRTPEPAAAAASARPRGVVPGVRHRTLFPLGGNPGEIMSRRTADSHGCHEQPARQAACQR